MTTDDLRGAVRAAAQQCRGHVWPNALGFDRYGWAYVYVPKAGGGFWWGASRGGRYGEGDTPDLARQGAR